MIAGARGASIVVLIFAAFIIMIFLTAAYGMWSTLSTLIPVWALLLMISLLGVGIMFGAALMLAKSHMH